MAQQGKKIRGLNELTYEEQRWLTLAVIHIMLSDEIVDKKEVAFLRQITRVFNQTENPEIIEEIKKLIKNKELPKLEPLSVENPEKLVFMLNTLCSAVFANEKKQEDEVKSYFQAGLKLGMTYDILMLKLAYQKERFRLKQAQKQVDEDIRILVKNKKSRSRD